MTLPMQLDLIALEPHRRVVAEVLAEVEVRAEVAGVLLIGSLAHGNLVPGLDVDLLLLVADGRSAERPTWHEERHGVWVELHERDAAWATDQMDRDPEGIYAYIEGRILRATRRATTCSIGIAASWAMRRTVTLFNERQI